MLGSPSSPFKHSLDSKRTLILLLTVSVLAFAGCKRSSSSYSPSNGSSSAGNPPIAPTSSSSKNLPYGFRALASSSGSGEVLIGGMTGNSASAALWAALNTLTGFFDSRPHALGAIVSVYDDEIQCLFDGTHEGQAIRGIAYAQATGASCVVSLVYDREEAFSQSAADLIYLAEQSLPAPTETPVPVNRTTLADGSTVDLPAGWNASANNGSISGSGPQGSFDLGLATEVYTPEAAAQFPVRPPLVAAYGDPGGALQELWTQMHVVESPDNVRIIERAPVSWWTSGPGEIFHLQASGPGNEREGFAEVLTSQSGIGKWMFYYSGVSSDQANFKKNLPVLLRIWRSWKTDDRVFQQRLQQAAESLQQVSQIIRSANAFRQDAMERSATAWDHYVRGTWPIEDQQTHARYIAQQDVSASVQQLNASEGYERWRVVPYEELNK